MPYIPVERRRALLMSGADPETSGELNYLITQSLMHYMQMRSVSYAVINEVLGALEGAKLEFYRRIAAPYENAKLAENGDIYD